MRIIYSIFLYLLLPLILLRLSWRARKAPDYRQRWSERFGIFPMPRLQTNVFWVHAVSVGESLEAIPMIEKLLTTKTYTSVVVTTTTPTGSDRIRHHFSHYPVDRFFHVYCPYDLPDCLWRFLNRVNPSLFILMETEVWPNTIAACAKRNIPVVLANGRLSEKSAKGYAKIRWLIEPAFRHISGAAVQAEADATRLQALGLRGDLTRVTGSIKFDLQLDTKVRDKAALLKQQINNPRSNLTLIAASTNTGEDEIILQAFKIIKRQEPNSFLILVPRHPERFDSVADLIKQYGFEFNRRSAKRLEVEADVLLGDTMGELLTLLGAADAAFIGGSLVPIGGHNLMEPATWALPILTGPQVFNFAEASNMLSEEGALTFVHNAEELANSVVKLWRDDEKRKVAGEKALAVANRNRGALDRLIKVIDKTMVTAARSQSVVSD